MKNLKNIKWSVLFLGIFLSFIFSFQSSQAAEGDLVWGVYDSPLLSDKILHGSAIDATGVYSAGGYFYSSPCQTILEKRSLNNGGLIWNKIENGNYSDAYVERNSSGLYLVPVFALNGVHNKLEKIDPNSGGVYWGVSLGFGSVCIAGHCYAGIVGDTHIDETGIYVLINNKAGENDDYLQKRSLTDGHLIWQKKIFDDEWGGAHGIFQARLSGSNGKLFISGSDFDSYQQSDVVRELSPWDGSTIREFHPAGLIMAVNNDPTGIYLSYEDGATNKVNIEKRDFYGNLIWGYALPSSSWDGFAPSVIMTGSGRVYFSGYAVGPNAVNGCGWYPDSGFSIQVRNSTNGTVLWDTGNTINNLEEDYETILWSALDPSGNYMYVSGGGMYAWDIEKRSLAPSSNLTASNFVAPANFTKGVSASLGGTVTNTSGVPTSNGFSDGFAYRYGTSDPWTSFPSNSVSHSAFAVGESGADSVSFTPPAAGSNLYLLYRVDSSFQVGESNESDNDIISGPYTVNNPPPSISLSASGCTIPVGASNCTGSVTWQFNYATAPYSVENVTTSVSISNLVNGASVPVTLKYGSNTIKAETNDTPVVSENRVVSASCTAGTEWTGTACEFPPDITFSANPKIIRSGKTADVVLQVTSSNPVDCEIINAQTASIIINHTGLESPKTYTNPTRPLIHTQIVNVTCTDQTTGLSTNGEARIEIVPTMQDV